MAKVNKISFNVDKNDLNLFTSLWKQLDSDLKFKLNRNRFHETHSVKYLGIQIDKTLTRKQEINQVTIKLNNANAMLSIKILFG